MKELTITNLRKTYGTKTLFDGIDLSIRTGDRIGLIGPNGTGKSSLLNVIAGLDTYDEGEISKPNQYEIALLEQNPQLNPNYTILDTVYDSKAPLIQLLKRYEKKRLELEAAPNNQHLQEEFTRLGEEMTLRGGWDVEISAKSILSQLGLNDLSLRVGDASGGQQKRIGIAQVLIAEPDLLILDEPTNHLDIESIQWLEKYLANYKGALLLVTHDRYFLDRVVNKIMELRFGKITEYTGNYETYLVKRAEQEAVESRVAQKQDRLFEQELAWMRKGAKARTTKQEARIGRFQDLQQTISDRNQSSDDIEFNFTQQRMGNQIMELENIDISIGDVQVIKDFSKTFLKGERLGIAGDNGVGKSTFLNTLSGDHQLDAGTFLVGQTIKMAYYRQLDEDLPNEMRVLEFLTKVADDFKRPDGSHVSAAQMLERFHFPRESHGSQIKSLSGGERRRLYLLTLLIQEPNVLLLDEPTNDLDIDTLTTLEAFLEDFEGVVIIVSHDRYFLDKTVDQVLELQGGGRFELFWGNYTDYLSQKADQEKEVARESKKELLVAADKDNNETEDSATTSIKKKQRMTYQEKKEWAGLEEKIEKIENRIDAINTSMVKEASDAVRLMDLQSELDEKEMELLELYERYEYLSELEQ